MEESKNNETLNLDLKVVDVHTKLRFASINENLPSMVKDAFKGISELSINLNFFIPRVHRTGNDAVEDELFQDLYKDRIESFKDSYSVALQPEFLEEAAQHALSYARWTLPSVPPQNEIMSIILQLLFPGIIWDFIVDNQRGFKKETDCGSSGESFKAFLDFYPSADKKRDDGNKENDQSGKMAAVQLMLENPLYAVIVKEFINIFDEFRDKDRTVMDQEVKRLAEAFLWEKSEQKKGNIALAIYPEVMFTLEELQLDDSVRESVYFKRWMQIAGEIGGMINDILGVQKDVKNGDATDIVMMRILGGESIVRVLQSEIKRFNANVSDYLAMRTALLNRFPKMDNLPHYIELVDSWLYGTIQVFQYSKLYDEVEVSFYPKIQ
ncbi:hypothetical protein Fcan01_16560 [Folsomia candida]|uniref:Terpene synthase n=1 Tax=Folsomia candida TaxID=158441 RepID=A0A226DWA8_FOLCA|nr:hypothetical protein Fcan01_16560 [Folsomia candida]